MSDSGISMWRSEWGNMRSLQEQIDSQMASAASEQRRLSSQLSRLQGDLSARVDRLTRAFDAFVELSALREDLALHADARRWRIAAKRMVEGTITGGIVPAEGGAGALADVPGYWLAPAVRALPDVIESGPNVALLDEAARRDELRTAVFVASVAPIVGSPNVAIEWLPRAWRAQSPTISVAERALWRAAVDGALPPGALVIVAEQLRSRCSADRDARAALVSRLVDKPPAAGSQIAPARRPAARRGAAGPADAMATLHAWTTWCATLRREQQPASGAGEADGSHDQIARDGLLSVVRSLVEEGSVDERPLLDRAEALSAVVAGGAPAEGANWDDDAGSCAELLEADLRDGASPAGARFALSVLVPEVVEAADELVRRAHATAPTEAVVDVAGRKVKVTVEGGDTEQLAEAHTALIVPVRPRLTVPVLYGAAAVVILSIVLAIVWSPGVLVVTAIVLVAVGATWLVDRRDAQAVAQDTATTTASAQQRVQASASALKEAADTAQEAAQEADRLRAELAQVLALPT